jgi:hypothetical protein
MLGVWAIAVGIGQYAACDNDCSFLAGIPRER